jgi:menaquinone-dependent protoporphyrinogen oxidase
MRERILVTYASKYGATHEIAARIGEVLKKTGWDVDVMPADRVNGLEPYRAVVLGSAVYAGQWQKSAVAFLEKYEKQLSDLPVWLFSSGPTGEGDPVALLKGWRFPSAQQALVDRILPRDVAVFHGDLDTKKLNFAEKLIIKGVKAPTGDYRDWESIDRWAESIVETLKQPLVP